MRLAVITVVGAALLVLPGAAGAKVVDLANAPGSVRFDGQASDDIAGADVADAGDVNGDGRPDLIVGAPRADNNSRAESGSAYVIYGGNDLANVDLQHLGAAGFRIDGAAAGDNAGFSVTGAGDLNGDGIGDLIVGAPFADPNKHSAAGSVYAIYGHKATDLPDIDLASVTTTQSARGVRIDGVAEGDDTGFAVARAGDINGDGRPDVIVAAPFADNASRDNSGSTYVLYGGHGLAGVDLASLGADGFRIDGAGVDDQSGTSVAGAGDLNGDGHPDLLLGAPLADNNKIAESGSAYVIYGQATVDPADVDLANITTTQAARGMRIDGAGAGALTGESVAAADLNGDGRDDAIVGAPKADNLSGLQSGAAYVVYGQPTADPTDVNLANIDTTQAARGMRIDGAAGGDVAGVAVAGGGDLNGDGHPDAIVGAPTASNNGRTQSGSAYVIFGEAAADPGDVDLTNIATAEASRGLRIDGAAEFDQLGNAVAALADVNGDGHPDALVGAPLASNNMRPDSGSGYVLDLAAPETTIDSGPASTTSDSTPTFSFHASEPASFRCSIDMGMAAFAPCSGPGATDTPASPLADGTHTFRVAAVDGSGNVDETPATETFTVDTASPRRDTTPPQTRITKHPRPKLALKHHHKRTRVRFKFASSEPGSTFRCRIDGRRLTHCASPKAYRLKRGPHTFAVVATDTAGNRDPSAAKFRLRVRRGGHHHHRHHG